MTKQSEEEWNVKYGNPRGFRYSVSGHDLPDSQNSFSSMTFRGTRGLTLEIRDNQFVLVPSLTSRERLSSRQFKDYLNSIGIMWRLEDWSLELPNGSTVAGRKEFP